MKYEVKNRKSIDRMDDEKLLNELLMMRGVDNPLSLLNVDNGNYTAYYHDAYDFVNMEKGLDLLWKHLDNETSHVHKIICVMIIGCVVTIINI